jgi:hypothetical protein
MRRSCGLTLTVFALGLGMFGQDDLTTFKAEAKSAFVWGEDAPEGAVSSSVQDPLTGNVIPKLSHAGIDVSSRMGFERAGVAQPGDFLNYTTTIVNGTDRTLSVRYGGISVDGQPASPLSIVPANKHLNKKEAGRNDVAELSKMNCYTSGFISGDNFFSANTLSQTLSVSPGNALTVSTVIRDLRSYSVRCSVEGCHPTGTIRYYIKVNNLDYVFVRPGRSVTYCGK